MPVITPTLSFSQHKVLLQDQFVQLKRLINVLSRLKGELLSSEKLSAFEMAADFSTYIQKSAQGETPELNAEFDRRHIAFRAFILNLVEKQMATTITAPEPIFEIVQVIVQNEFNLKFKTCITDWTFLIQTLHLIESNYLEHLKPFNTAFSKDPSVHLRYREFLSLQSNLRRDVSRLRRASSVDKLTLSAAVIRIVFMSGEDEINSFYSQIFPYANLVNDSNRDEVIAHLTDYNLGDYTDARRRDETCPAIPDLALESEYELRFPDKFKYSTNDELAIAYLAGQRNEENIQPIKREKIAANRALLTPSDREILALIRAKLSCLFVAGYTASISTMSPAKLVTLKSYDAEVGSLIKGLPPQIDRQYLQHIICTVDDQASVNPQFRAAIQQLLSIKKSKTAAAVLAPFHMISSLRAAHTQHVLIQKLLAEYEAAPSETIEQINLLASAHRKAVRLGAQVIKSAHALSRGDDLSVIDQLASNTIETNTTWAFFRPKVIQRHALTQEPAVAICASGTVEGYDSDDGPPEELMYSN